MEVGFNGREEDRGAVSSSSTIRNVKTSNAKLRELLPKLALAEQGRGEGDRIVESQTK